MNGHVDNDGRALLTLAIRPLEEAAPCEVEAWIDTVRGTRKTGRAVKV